jgi:transglutaminase-like putative cysteine protease
MGPAPGSVRYPRIVDIESAWLEPTWFIDSDAPSVHDFATEAVGDATEPTDVAVRLFHAVRDGLRYDPYGMARNREEYRASVIAGMKRGWCVTKSVLLTAAARNRGIPARLGFADVRNHLSSEKLRAKMGTDLFIWHGYSELLLGDRWFKVSSAFNVELCDRFGVRVLEFDGTDDALMHPYDRAGNRHMEYVNQRGSFVDLPLEQMFSDFARLYPEWSDLDSRESSAEAAGDEAFAAPEG